MTATNKIFKICILILLIKFVSCNEEAKLPQSQVHQDHKILSVVIDSISAYDSPRSLWPVPPPNKDGVNTLTREDSLKHKELIAKFLDKFITIGIDTNLVLYLPDYKTTEKLIQKGDMFAYIGGDYDSLQKIKIDIDKINLTKRKNIIYYDSITYFNPSEHLTKYRSYKGINYRFNFSKIRYNEDKTRASIRYQQRFEDRFPEGGLFLLAKENKKWQIIDGYRFMPY